MNNSEIQPKDYKFDPQTGKPIIRLPELTKRDNVYIVLLCLFSLIAANFTIMGGLALGFTIGYVLLISCALLYLKDRLSFKPFNIVCLLSALVSAVSFSVYSNSELAIFKFLFIVVASSMFFVSACGLKSPAADDFRALLAPFYLFFGIGCRNCTDSFKAVSVNKNKSGNMFRKVLIGLLISIPALAILTSLLTSADAAFDAFVSSLNIRFSEVFITLFFGIILFCFAFSLFLSVCKNHNLPKESTKAPYLSVIDSTVVNTVLSVISVLYLVFLFTQLGYLVGGFAGMRPEELTFAEYARRGFGEMCVICILNIGILFIMHALVKRTDCKLPRFTRILSVFIYTFSIFLVAAAIAKMFLYISQYGLTVLRLGTSVFMLFMFFVSLSLIVKMFNGKFNHIRMITIAACVIMMAVSVADINTTVVNFNYNNYVSSNADIDVYYLGTCGDSAVPVLATLKNSGDKEIASKADEELRSILYSHAHVNSDGTVRNWNNYDFRNYTVAYLHADDILRDIYGEIAEK